MYTPSMDCGDNIIVINAEKVKLSGNKKDKKIYYWHTGHPGGIKDRTARDILEGEYPERVVMQAVKRMLHNGPLSREQLKNLRVFAGSEHTHYAQQPEVLDVAAMNEKNSRNSNNG
jgi:large subunit ribosomal protein L13